jgi:adenylylsulfate kinase
MTQSKEKRLIPGTIWITGISASGKTTLGKSLSENLKQHGFENVKLLDGEDLRQQLDRVYGHSVKERFAVLRNIVRIANEYKQQGYAVIVSTISHKKAMREIARTALLPFTEVRLECSVETCRKRDYKGNYAKAFAGELATFIGVTEPYESSDAPELVLNTEALSSNECSEILFRHALSLFEKRSDYSEDSTVAA